MKNVLVIVFLLTAEVISGGEIIPEEKVEFYQIKPDIIDHVMIRFNSYSDGTWNHGDKWERYDILRKEPDRVLLIGEYGDKFNLMKAFMNIPSIDIKLIRRSNAGSIR